MKEIRKRDIELIQKKQKLPYDGFVYFIGSFKKRYVKIGYSKEPERRMAEIQTGCPFKVRLLFILNAPPKKELELHKRFRYYVSWGEWFHLRGGLRKYVMDSMGLRKDPVKQSMESKHRPHELDEQFKQMFSKW